MKTASKWSLRSGILLVRIRGGLDCRLKQKLPRFCRVCHRFPEGTAFGNRVNNLDIIMKSDRECVRSQRKQSMLKETIEEDETQHSQAASQFLGKWYQVNTARNNRTSISACARLDFRPTMDEKFKTDPHLRDHFMKNYRDRGEAEVDKLRQILFRSCEQNEELPADICWLILFILGFK